jgi:hypothetical protein
MPNCTLTGIAIRPSDPIKHLQMVVFLQTPIYNYTLIREQHGINVRTEVDFPCDIKGQSSDPDDRLTFTISPDRKQILVIGHDLSSYDDQTLLLTFYPDPQWNEDAGRLTSDGSATYVAHGREIPARIKWISR